MDGFWDAGFAGLDAVLDNPGFQASVSDAMLKATLLRGREGMPLPSIEALAIDSRGGLFLPCRITLVETEHGVQVMSINPKNLSQLFDNQALDKACQQMRDLYEEIVEEATR